MAAYDSDRDFRDDDIEDVEFDDLDDLDDHDGHDDHSALNIETYDAVSPLARWAHDVGRTRERRDARDADNGSLEDRHSLGGIFRMEDKVTLLEAWKRVGGHRMGVATKPATTPHTTESGDVELIDIPAHQWIYPTLDGEYFNLPKPLGLVSTRRYEIVDPNDVVALMAEHFTDTDGKPLNVTAIAFRSDLSGVLIEFEQPAYAISLGARDSMSFEQDADWVRRYLTVHIPIQGSVTVSAIDARMACWNYMPMVISSAVLKVRHLTGANDRITNEYRTITQQLDIAQRMHAFAYDVLCKLPLMDGDVDRLIEHVYPYEGLPEGISQLTPIDVMSGWLDRIRDFSAGKPDAPQPTIQVPVGPNRKVVEARRLAYHGINLARVEVGDNLWALAQANYSSTHHGTKSQEARVHDMLVTGWRRRQASKIFTTVLGIAYERGADLTGEIQGVAQAASEKYWQKRGKRPPAPPSSLAQPIGVG